ncbi:outer membrane protein assembly factor BamA [Arsenicitalea aurantiaca]|uniref:Outer membrane protein assembly factor BamA n=1 Tax=Arsenicitalea aurantiaca TaxID=1783274 RepID=A0A433XF31_9HYPH|nr:outer membrane protein assembly factor BamA [Arsenicitalea aurantiaca]RUT32727.1 outer membrane protein assembly factor BamA [Arsenicitalea aurantiaca]
MIDPNKLMRGVFLALPLTVAAPVLGVGGPLLGVTEAQAQTVSRIAVTGNSRVDDATVASYLTVRVGQAATQAQIDASIASLYQTGLFSDASVSYSGGTLSVRVVENAIVASVLFEGNRRFSDAQLMAMINSGNRGAISSEIIQRDAESIRLAYNQVGYSNVTVTPRTEATQGGRTRVVFVVNEGERAGIAAINFTGNNNFSSGALKSVIRTRETHLLSWLFQDDNYTDAQLEIDRELIRLYYANNGYPDAQVTSAVAEYDPSRNGYYINFTVVEGQRYEFGNVGIETSIAGLNADALRGSVRTREGSRYSLSEIERTAQDLAIGATDQGYPFADVRPRMNRDLNGNIFDVTYLVDEGPRIYVERINITGNNKTRDYVIRRELEFAEGDPFNRSLVTRGKSSIENLRFFKVVNITTEQGSAPDQVVINVAVEEDSTGDYGITAGYSTADGILGEVSITERNFLGRGQFVRAAVGATGSGQTFDFSFTEPRFMGLRISSGIDVYHRIQDEGGNARYGTTATGGQIRFGLPVTRDLNASLFTGLETRTIYDAEAPFTQLFDPVGSTTNPETGPSFADGLNFNKAWVGYTLTYNTLNDNRRPTEGVLATFTQQYVGWDHNYIKTEARARYFTPLIQDSGMVASVRGQAGIINDLSGDGVHPIEAYRHGPSLIRGFQPRSLGPRTSEGEALGSTMYAGISAEIEFPIPVLPETYGIRGAVWADAAYIDGLAGADGQFMVTDGSIDENLKASVGASIIWDSPFGPLRGDFGYVVQKATDDRPQVFQLTLQTLL